MGDLSLIIVLIAAALIIGVLFNSNKKLQQQVADNLVQDQKLERMIIDRLKAGQDKVAIVKFVREHSGLGLVEAKKYVDNIEADLNGKGPVE
ncbi:ribosomal protein L7/L12 [Jeotgalibacillus aurantiacus]|uniref:ribosomal protein L7/L12 n=1 Tax=Jeotgalibacillus aurantiacus TaxID=2763266 RepID=UPI001D0B23C6|nr:ribosomal protein L7/L12 [Jeotgalibacillus aurantiacus]